MFEFPTPSGTFDPAATLLVIGGLALAGGLGTFLIRDPDLRRVAVEMLDDPELRAAVRDAVSKAGRAVVASWVRNGGPNAVAGVARRIVSPAT